MRTVPLGDTGLMVSEVGFGGIPLTRVAPQDVEPLLGRALDLGFRFFDTARMYGDSEEKLGRGLAGRREMVVLASKTMARDGKTATAELETSLQNLRTDYLDLYQLHNVAKPEVFDQVMAPGGALEAAERAREQGKVRHIGFSSHHPDIAIQTMATGRFATVQFACNFVEDAASGRVFAEAQKRGMGCIAMKPLGGGLLERADLCFGWLRGREGVVPIPGIQSLAEAEEIAALYAAPPRLSPADLAEMERIRAELGTRFCRRCGYCMPCPNGVEIPWVMLFRSQVRRFPPEVVMQLSGRVMAGAAECQDCGECVERCPYDLPIPEMIAETLAAFRDFQAAHGLA